MNNKNKKINEKGQTLLFVIVAVTIALAVGVAVSTRTISSLRRVTRTDTSARVIAAAEGGIENLLGRTYSQLDEALSPSEEGCSAIGAIFDGTSCVYVLSGNATGVPEPECLEYQCECNYCITEGGDECAGSFSFLKDIKFKKLNYVYAAPEFEQEDIFLCPSQQIPCGPYYFSCNDGDKRDWCTSMGGITKQTDTCLSTAPVNSEDLISSRARVTVEKFRSNLDREGYAFDLNPGSVQEIFIPTTDYGFSEDEAYNSKVIEICWTQNNSAIYYYSYNSDGDVVKGGILPKGTSGEYIDSDYLSPRFVDSDDSVNKPGMGDVFCKTVDLVEEHYGLRVKVLYNTSKIAVYPASEGGAEDPTLPYQGYKLTSVGEITTGSGSEEKATVIVHKSYPHAVDIFDYGIYTPGTLQ